MILVCRCRRTFHHCLMCFTSTDTGAAVNLLASARGPAFLASMALSTVLRAAPAIALLWRVRGIGRPAYSHLGIPLRVFSIRPTRGLSIQPWPGLPAAAPEAAAPLGTPAHRVEDQVLGSTSCG